MTKPGLCRFVFDLARAHFCVCFPVFQVHVLNSFLGLQLSVPVH